MNLTTHQSKFEKLRNRRLPLEKQAQYFTEEFQRATKRTHYEYLVETMQPISDEYTEETFQQGDLVKEVLEATLDGSYSARYDYQGSVTSDTHIQVHSDIDLLTIHGGFVSNDIGVAPASPYRGQAKSDLQNLRTACEAILLLEFSEEDVDTSGGKAIGVSGGSLQRKIDVVVANWWDTERYKETALRKFRGVRIFNSKTEERIRNLPFLHNARIDAKDRKTNTGLRKAIRLLKSLKYDADPVLSISSYDVAALAYSMPDEELQVPDGGYLPLAIKVNDFLEQVIANSALRDSLKVPNGTRRIFCSRGATLEGLKALYIELQTLLTFIHQEEFVMNSMANEAVTEFSHGQRMAPWAETRPHRVAAMLQENNRI